MNSYIKDNRNRGSVGDFLKEKIKSGSKLSFVSTYFTIYAYDKLKNELNDIDSLEFLFGEPRFINNLDPSQGKTQSFLIECNNLKLQEQLVQKAVVKDCSDWIKQKVRIKSIRNSDLLHGKLYHIDNNGIEKAIIGSSNFEMGDISICKITPYF